MKQFNIPTHYKSTLIAPLKQKRNAADRMKKDHSPALLDFGTLRLHLARHFGFCFGVENAIEIAQRALADNPDKRIYLLSQMIHNPLVNQDLEDQGLRFIQDTSGKQLIEWDALNEDDIVVIPAFGTTVEIEALLAKKGIQTEKYDTTCPFVERVWKRSSKLGKEGFTIVIHGKEKHEETRATFSRSRTHGAAIVIRDMAEAEVLAAFVRGERPLAEFKSVFAGKTSEGFEPARDLKRIGVINQTTMLASDTQAIALFLKSTVSALESNHEEAPFADTRDTLCYATNDNQTATQELLEQKADFALVVGGYNSSNTSHLVDLCAEKLPTYFIPSADCLEADSIAHFKYGNGQLQHTPNWLPTKRPVSVLLTSGASCPDAAVEAVIHRLNELTNGQPDQALVLANTFSALGLETE